jgi:arylsulfatase A-like enzyme
VNVVLISADDMRADMLRFMPFTNSVLRREGTTFSAARTNNVTCQGQNVGLITGQYALHNGVYQNDQELPDWTIGLLPGWVQAEGVTTGVIGEMPGGYNTLAVRPGWDTWRVLRGANILAAYGYELTDGAGGSTTPAGHQVTTLGGLCVDFIEANAGGDFFLWHNSMNPHIDLSFYNTPLPASVNRYSWLDWDLDLLLDTTGKPSWIAALAQHDYNVQTFTRATIRSQARECRDLDGIVENVYNTLLAEGVLEDTIFIFGADGGVVYGEQRIPNSFTGSMKDQPYDCVERVPLIVRGPGFDAGAEVALPVTTPDITATIVAAFGATPSLTLDGIDLTDQAALAARPGTLYERADNGTYPDAQGIRTATRTLTHYPTEGGFDEWEMYYIDLDPTQIVNLGNEGGSFAAERAVLEAQLAAILAS